MPHIPCRNTHQLTGLRSAWQNLNCKCMVIFEPLHKNLVRPRFRSRNRRYAQRPSPLHGTTSTPWPTAWPCTSSDFCHPDTFSVRVGSAPRTVSVSSAQRMVRMADTTELRSPHWRGCISTQCSTRSLPCTCQTPECSTGLLRRPQCSSQSFRSTPCPKAECSTFRNRRLSGRHHCNNPKSSGRGMPRGECSKCCRHSQGSPRSSPQGRCNYPADRSDRSTCC